jgi:DNA-binding NarL/FixJ family response regulator
MRVLVASAEAAFCQEIQTLLESVEGITAIEEQAGPQILDQIQELQPDLILLDLDGVQAYSPDLVSTISRRRPDVRILVLSAPGQERHALDALRGGAHGHLIKGTGDHEQLISALKAVGRGDAILSPTMAGLVLDELNHLILDEMNHRYEPREHARAAAGVQARSLDLASDQQTAE